jgi:hypothetical protein
MKPVIGLGFLLIMVGLALAQPQSLEQRIGAQLGQLAIQNSAQLMQIEELQAKIKELQAKCETPKEEKK